MGDLIIAGDIGGTNSRFMVYEVRRHMRISLGRKAPGKLIFERIYTNEGVGTFREQVTKLMKDANIEGRPPLAACIAVAGPVETKDGNSRVTMTNRGWVIDASELSSQFGIGTVRLINDFVAAGYGLLTLDIGSECVVIQEGNPTHGAPIACLGSGTGLGETFLTRPVNGEVYDAFPSEGGHCELAARNPLQYEMVQWLKDHCSKNHPVTRISVERVVSGTGLWNVYQFLRQRFPDRVNKKLDAEIEGAGDLKAKVIATHSKGAQEDSLCKQVMEIWAEHYGAEAGVLALKTLPFNGLYLAGGMTPKNMDWIKGAEKPFLQAFKDKGRVSGILDNVPIYAVLEEDIGQRGAQYVAFTMYKGQVDLLTKQEKQVETHDSSPSQARHTGNLQGGLHASTPSGHSGAKVLAIAALSAGVGALLMRSYKK